MAAVRDDLEAVRLIVEALTGLAPEEQERAIRWAREKLGLLNSNQVQNIPANQPPADPNNVNSSGQNPDIKSFATEKQPGSDTQFAAVVAYFYRFVARDSEKNTEIDSEILMDAFRKANRDRPNNANQTLRNAHRDGYLDKGKEIGKYSINAVGENLVAMALPSESQNSGRMKKKNKKLLKKSGSTSK